MPESKTIYVQFSDLSTKRNDILERPNPLITNAKNKRASNNNLIDAQKFEPRTQKKTKLRSLWTKLPCCTSVSSFLQFLTACFLTIALILAVVLPIWFISLRTTSTTTTSISITNNSTTIMSNTTTTNAISANASTISTSMTTDSTSASTTSTSTTMITTNICTGGYTYVTQLLYLNINSGLPWTQYEFNYTAPNVTTATITFSFRDDPNFWYLDAVSVTNSSGQQLLSNPGFELGTLANWVYCNPSNASHSGSVTGSGCYSGWYCYADGSVGAPDYLSQTFSVQPNNIYTVSFWLCAYGPNMTFAWITIST